jgi:hypothetical protein
VSSSGTVFAVAVDDGVPTFTCTTPGKGACGSGGRW